MGSIETDSETRSYVHKVYLGVFLGNNTYKEVRKTKVKIRQRENLTHNVVATWPQQILQRDVELQWALSQIETRGLDF